MTRPKKATKKKKKSKDATADESAFPGRTFDELVGALLKVPHKKTLRPKGHHA